MGNLRPEIFQSFPKRSQNFWCKFQNSGCSFYCTAHLQWQSCLMELPSETSFFMCCSLVVTREELESMKEAAWPRIHMALRWPDHGGTPTGLQAKHCYPEVAVMKMPSQQIQSRPPSLRPWHGQMCPDGFVWTHTLGQPLPSASRETWQWGDFKRPTSGGDYRHLYKSLYNSEKILLRLELGKPLG